MTSTATATDPVKARTYGNWRKPQTAGLGGLGQLATLVMFVGIVASIIASMFSGLGPALLVAGIFGGILLTVSVKDKHGQSALGRTVVRVNWWHTKSKGANIYRSGPTGRAKWGTFQLPGLAAASQLTEHEDSHGRRFALISTPTTRHFTVVLATEPDGAALVDQEQINNQVAEYGIWLANLGDEPGIEAASVTVETAPDTGTRLRGEVEGSMDPDAPLFARAMLQEVVGTYPVGSATIRAYIALTFTATARIGGKRRNAKEVASDLSARIPGLTSSLAATGAGAARPLNAQELCEVIRTAYDPDAAVLIDQARAAGETADLSWTDVGPAAAEAHWDSYRHDGAVSTSWTMTAPPRGVVQAGILARLLAPHRDIARKRVTLLYRPIDPARAAALVEADLNAAQFNSSASTKPTARSTLSTRSAQATAAEEASGAGLMNFGLIVTATTMQRTQEPEARAAIDSLTSAARLRMRPAFGSQDSAFAAALPLGLILPRHLRIPNEVREAL
ncbi:SCO6880 family protein [Rathayibacter sp. VKM Ac-2760]|uniref:SCO6880 family protein n=1 Tax=Rathayibacter sp. VKM Ac-2760 TaxID=2609253 RepID=UPI001ABDD241|nr:SCO6880 family protein [Rathayibacter sp. VKM Ac-2760]